jgi:DnaJ domain
MMARKDPYAILGVGRGAALSEIKRAYRKLAFSAHPDVGDNPDAQRFRELHEAYAALNEMQHRRARRIKVLRVPDRSGYAGATHVEPRRGPEPIRRRDPVNVIDDFGTVSPSVGEILDHLAELLRFSSKEPCLVEAPGRRDRARHARSLLRRLCADRSARIRALQPLRRRRRGVGCVPVMPWIWNDGDRSQRKT